MRTIELQKVSGSPRPSESQYSETDEINEPQAASAAPVEETSPVTIQVEAIRCFYPRRNNAPGTRITFTDGGGFAVADTYEAVKALIAG